MINICWNKQNFIKIIYLQSICHSQNQWSTDAIGTSFYRPPGSARAPSSEVHLLQRTQYNCMWMYFSSIYEIFYLYLFLFSLLRHVLFAESSVNTYAGSSFPGLADGMFEIESSPDEASRWEIVKKHFTVILYTIESAASTLRDVHKFMPL